jgi:hypothetical protein
MVQEDFSLMKNRYGMDGMTYHADVDVCNRSHIEMDETPREFPDPSTSAKLAFANEITSQDRKQLSQLSENFFVNSSES